MLDFLLLIQVHALMFKIVFKIIYLCILLWKLVIKNERKNSPSLKISMVTISILSDSEANDFNNMFKYIHGN